MFSYYNLENSIPIAVTEKSRKIVYYVDDVNCNENKLKAIYLKKNSELIHNDIIDFIKEPILFKEFKLGQNIDDQFVPIENKEREVYSIIAPSGSGKSVLCAKLVKEYLEKNPENDVYLLSNKNENEDPAYDGLKIQYINVLQMNNPVNLKNFDKKSLIIIDDLLEGVIIPADSELMKELENLSGDDYLKQQKLIKAKQTQLNDVVVKSVINIMALGRSKQISLYLIKHSMRDGKSNIMKTENTSIILFPNTSKQQIKDYTKSVLGFSKKEVDYLFTLKESQNRFQFLFISCQGIKYVISNKNIFCVNNIDV